MKWYFYLNYFVYRFYSRIKGDIPVFRAFSVSVALVSFNCYIIWGVYGFITDFWMERFVRSAHPKLETALIMSFFGLINYLLLYRKKKYQEVFEEFRQESDKYKQRWDKSVKIYIFSTIGLSLIVLIIAGIRNHYLGLQGW